MYRAWNRPSSNLVSPSCLRPFLPCPLPSSCPLPQQWHPALALPMTLCLIPTSFTFPHSRPILFLFRPTFTLARLSVKGDGPSPTPSSAPHPHPQPVTGPGPASLMAWQPGTGSEMGAYSLSELLHASAALCQLEEAGVLHPAAALLVPLLLLLPLPPLLQLHGPCRVCRASSPAAGSRTLAFSARPAPLLPLPPAFTHQVIFLSCQPCPTRGVSLGSS